MGKKCKCPEVKKTLSAPFYFITFSDLMTQLMAFFVLLYSMSTVQKIKFDTQVSILQSSLGIAKAFPFSPMQSELPAPAIKKDLSKPVVTPKTQKSTPSAAHGGPETEMNGFEAVNQTDEETRLVESVQHLGIQADLEFEKTPDDMILHLPTWGIFEKGSAKIDASSPEVKKVKMIYEQIAKQLALLTNYNIYFIGHTDNTQMRNEGGNVESNIDLGFQRALSLYSYFFKAQLDDMTRITFSSKGDTAPIVADAKLDSERRKNRRVEIYLRRKKTAN